MGRLREQLITLPRRSSWPVTDVLLAGECAMHDHFLVVVRDVLVALNDTIAGDGRGMESAIPGLDLDVMADPTFCCCPGRCVICEVKIRGAG